MKLFAAGSGGKFYFNTCREMQIPKLYSFMQKAEVKLVKEWDKTGLPLIVDSGAHSWNKQSDKIGGKQRLKLPDIYEYSNRYFDFIKQNSNRSIIFVELDCYDILGKSFLDDFYEKIKKEKRSFTFMRVYHPIVDNGSLKVFRQWIDQGERYIGIANDSVKLLNRIFGITKDKIKLHGFAMTNKELLKRYPFYSADSTTSLAVVRYGHVYSKNMVCLNRAKIRAEKKIEALYDGKKRLTEALKMLKERECYMTKLWKKRGVVWED